MQRSDWDDGVSVEDESSSTRPYVVAGGRTAAPTAVSVETIVESTDVQSNARFEKRELLDAAHATISVAELSAHLRIPIGTTMVLVGELLEDGSLTAHDTAEQSSLSEMDIMTRIIDRVRGL